MIFVYLEKVYERVLREILKWALMMKVLPEIYVNVIEDMDEGVSQRVGSLCRILVSE